MYIIQDLFICLLPTAFDVVGSFCFCCYLYNSSLTAINTFNYSANTDNKEVLEKIKNAYRKFLKNN